MPGELLGTRLELPSARGERRSPKRTMRGLHCLLGLLFAALAALVCLAAGPTQVNQASPAHNVPPRMTPSQQASSEYVGSKTCARCHLGIFNSYLRTDMGRSMTQVDAAFLAKFPTTASITSVHLNRHFEVYARDGKLYQSEYALTADGKEEFRETERIEYIIGAGDNGLGGIVRHGNYLFEAPLSYYSRINGWDLSPGYQSLDLGFSRPILPGCVVCHSGRPQPDLAGNGLFGEPAFYEMSVGCENCHGPGKSHVEEQEGLSQAPGAIVNPANLTPWLADNICMQCHQTGDARVLRLGKNYGDIRPGEPLDNTLSIFMVPFDRTSPPQDDLLEYYLSMRLSMCYQNSGGRMSCITCHDPHVQPVKQQAPEYFKNKCLICHNLSSCTAKPALRQATNPPDNCVGCHMPQRNLRGISHSALTNHRITAKPDEPFPDSAYQMATPALPDLVHLSAPAGDNTAPSPLMLLDVYRQVLLTHPEYRPRYWALANQLKDSQPLNISVLEALADFSQNQENDDGVNDAIHDLELVQSLGGKVAADYEQLAALLVATGQWQEAVKVLQKGIDIIPDDEEMYRMLAKSYFFLGRQRDACELLRNAIHLFPHDEVIRGLLNPCEESEPEQPKQ